MQVTLNHERNLRVPLRIDEKITKRNIVVLIAFSTYFDLSLQKKNGKILNFNYSLPPHYNNNVSNVLTN